LFYIFCPRITGEFDLVVLKSNVNGLKVDSVIKLTKVATLSKDLIIGKIVELEEVYLKEVDGKLKIIFNLYLLIAFFVILILNLSDNISKIEKNEKTKSYSMMLM
jgi:hypothetical protein